MGKYTTHKEKWIEEAVQGHIDVITSELKNVDGVVSALLVGGFGRGEGTVKIEGKKVIPINDYDVYMIVNRDFGEEEINKIAKRIEKKMGTPGFSLYKASEKSFYVDIRTLNINKLNLPPLIKYYELKHASYLLLGPDLRKNIDVCSPEELPLPEGARFLLNRMSHIFDWTPIEEFQGRPVPAYKKDCLLYDISKAYLSCCTALTLLAGVYKPTYQKRLESLRKVYGKFPLPKNLLSRIDTATRSKLKPDYSKTKKILPEWFKAKEDLFIVVPYYLKEFAGIRDWDELYPKLCSRYFKPYISYQFKKKLGFGPGILLPVLNVLAQFYLTISWFFRIKRFAGKFYPRCLLDYRDPGMRIFSALPYLIDSIGRDGNVDAKKLRKAAKNLKRAYPVDIDIKPDLKSFDKMREAYIDAWKLYFFQKFP